MASSNSMSVRRIDRQRFERMLNMLPPASWMGIGTHAESFRTSEGISADITTFYCRIGADHFELTGDVRSSHGAVAARCRTFLQSGETAAPAVVASA
jgi:hypothetical protein